MGVQEKILTYLSMYGKENKYRLASALKIDEEEIIKALIDLEKKGRIEIKSGRVMLVKGKKPTTTAVKKQKKQPRVEIKEEIKEPEVEKKEYEKEEYKKEEEKEETEEAPLEEEPEEEQPQTEVSEEPSEEEVRKTFRVKEESNERIEGTVKFFNPNKGFGFITGDDGKEYYVHKSGLKEGVTIEADDRVSFKPVEGDKGPKAEEVEWISQT